MKFIDFITNGKVRKSQPDVEQAKSLVKIAQKNFQAIQTIDLTDETSSILFSQSYESLRQVVEALCLIEGFKVYSHEAYTYYLKEHDRLYESEVFDRLRRLRNGINYYGKPVSITVTQNAFHDIQNLITIFTELIDEKIKQI